MCVCVCVCLFCITNIQIEKCKNVFLSQSVSQKSIFSSSKGVCFQLKDKFRKNVVVVFFVLFFFFLIWHTITRQKFNA